jgi:hypothetical protein
VAVQHFHTSTGGVIQLPEYDNQRRVVVDAQGRPKMVPVVMLPNWASCRRSQPKTP